VSATSDLAAVTRERAAFWSALAEDDGRPWTVDVAAAADRAGFVVALSAGEASAVIDALVGNVFAHTPEGSAYALAVRPGDDGTVRLEVDDSGAGIDRPGAAVDRGATRGGSTGLGLDIARRSAEAAGGRLQIEASHLGGARVVLTLPVIG